MDPVRYEVGQVIACPTLSKRCVLVDQIEWNALLSNNNVVPPHGLPPHHAVVFEVLKNGEALAAYNSRYRAEQLALNPALPVLWLRIPANLF